MIPMIGRNFKNYAILLIPKLDYLSKLIVKTALTNIQVIQTRPGRLSVNLLHVNLGKQR